MSHFTVLIAAKNEADLEHKLEGYYEQGDESDWFMEFNDHEAEWRNEYENNSTERIKTPDGEHLEPWDKRFKVAEDPSKPFFTKTVIPEDYERVEVPFRLMFPTFEAFVEDWHGQKERPYGYLGNPNAKWDWYLIGGRWTGLLKLKAEVALQEEIIAGNGRPGIMTSPNDDPTQCDWTLSKYVDWEGILTAQLENKMSSYHSFQEALANVVFPKDEYVDEEENVLKRARETWNDNTGRGENCRKFFRTQTDFLRNCLADIELWDKGIHFFDTFEECADRMYKTEDEYREIFCADALTFAYVDTEGMWHEKAEMGFWAMTRNENEKYDKEFWEFIKSLDDEQRVYVVDCHI